MSLVFLRGQNYGKSMEYPPKFGRNAKLESPFRVYKSVSVRMKDACLFFGSVNNYNLSLRKGKKRFYVNKLNHISFDRQRLFPQMLQNACMCVKV